MILNMNNGSSNAQYVYRLITTIGNPNSQLVINNVQIPDGIVKGFALIRTNTYTANDKEVISAYADQARAVTEDFVFNTYFSSTGSTGKSETADYADSGFEYDSSAQTLTFTLPQSQSYVFFGVYALLIIW